MSTTFKFGSTTLASIGKVTLINEYLDMPARRGENITLPYRHGTVYVPKYYDQRKMTFGIAVVAASETALETALDSARALFAVRTTQTLEMTKADTTKRTALATVDAPIDAQRFAPGIARIVVEFTLCSSYWRGENAIADNTLAIDASPKAMTVTNTGSVEEREATIIIHGAFTSITITNSTNGAVLTYTGVISTSETVTIGTLNGEFYATLSTGAANVIGGLTHSGSSALLPLEVGANTLAITSTGKDANSTVKITFYPPFL
jgi:hypothetical protein